MGNKITEWSYELPTEPGLYLACYGDVEVPGNILFVDADYVDWSNELYDQEGDPLTGLSSSYKWARLLVGSEAKSDD